MTSPDAQLSENQAANIPAQAPVKTSVNASEKTPAGNPAPAASEAAAQSKARPQSNQAIAPDSANAKPKDALSTNEATSTQNSRLSRPIGKMPVEIRIELGVFEIPVEDAASIKPGQMLKLHSDCPGQVKLLCRDHEIGRGELVDINGRLGVKILHNWCK